LVRSRWCLKVYPSRTFAPGNASGSFEIHNFDAWWLVLAKVSGSEPVPGDAWALYESICGFVGKEPAQDVITALVQLGSDFVSEAFKNHALVNAPRSLTGSVVASRCG
jgi:hypothetical protein